MQESPNKKWLARWADDLSCAVFALANAVTIMYFIVDRTTKVFLPPPPSPSRCAHATTACSCHQHQHHPYLIATRSQTSRLSGRISRK